MVRWCWVNFQCRGILLIWIIVSQGPIALAVGAGGVVWTFFLACRSIGSHLTTHSTILDSISRRFVVV